MSNETDTPEKLQETISRLKAQLETERMLREVALQSVESSRAEIAEVMQTVRKQQSLADVEALVIQLAEQQKQALADLESRMAAHTKRELLNTVKQLEAYMGVQSFLRSGEVALNFHGWPISSDIALFLIEKVMSEDYDLVIEFGSGTSTAIFARAFQILGNAKDSSTVKRVVTFEHKEKYLDQTGRVLARQQCSEIVDLVHAPLADQIFEGVQYSFYSCREKLSELALKYSGQKSKILVLVDGPPAATCRHARFPALLVLLEHLCGHDLHIVLDDFNRAEEKEIVADWQEILRRAPLNYSVESLPLEKGACVISVAGVR